ncbi:MAG TPA: hypothetical protein VH988_05070 [Thermoanaerobaculia bacterium]|jgi:hypothetical protein|nr:hypothetical protein [Thermoanaerobaculia bacterium]
MMASLGALAASAEVTMVEHHALKSSLKRAGNNKAAGNKKPSKATGSQALIDNSGVKYFINTNITFSTSSSASAAMSEASYTHAVAASTLNGGTTSSTLNDAYDGYNTLCLSLNNTVATCETGNANFVIYNKNGPPTTECTGATSGVNRQVVFPVQTSGTIQMQRKVFVPDNDAFARWLNYFTNTGGSPVTVTMVIANNLGSDSNTVITGSSNGNNTAEVADTWVTSFQNWGSPTPTTSSDPRLGHVLQGPGAAVPLAGIHFVDGDDNPFWGYTFTLNPGETKIIMNFAVVQPSKAAAAAKSSSLATQPPPPSALQCLSTTEQQEIANFGAAIPIVQVPTVSGIGLLTLACGLALAALAVLLKRRSAAA